MKPYMHIGLQLVIKERVEGVAVKTMTKELRETEPFIHLFSTSIGYYFFDVNTDAIVKIPERTYKKLQSYQENETDEYINKLKRIGLLQPNRKRITKHPETDYLQYHFKTNLSTLLLQVTQNCNQRCDYCVYSGKYNNRTHSNVRMSFEMAQKGIDLILHSSLDAPQLFFGFYGGEPLLEIDLIKKCIEYIDKNIEGKKVQYNITTNATLLTEDIIELFSKHNVALLISIDGPADIHNKNRTFATGTGNTHSVIINNLKVIKHKYPKYFRDYVSFNTVLDGRNSFKYVDDFFTNNKLFNNSICSSTLIAENYAKDPPPVSEEYVEESRYASFLILLSVVGRLDGKNISKLFESNKSLLEHLRDDKKFGERMQLPFSSHHTGNCIPGINKLFLSVTGDFYPCEKVSECSKICKIGTIEDGFEIEKIKKLLNIENFTRKECQNCWAYESCTMCLAYADGLDELSRKLMLKRCDVIRSNAEEIFKDYCVCKEIEKQKENLQINKVV